MQMVNTNADSDFKKIFENHIPMTNSKTKAFEKWKHFHFPNRKQELWKYNSWSFLRDLQSNKRQLPDQSYADNLLSLNNIKLFFVDGILDTKRSSNHKNLNIFIKDLNTEKTITVDDYFSALNKTVCAHTIHIEISGALELTIVTEAKKEYQYNNYFFDIHSENEKVKIIHLSLVNCDTTNSFSQFNIEKQSDIEFYDLSLLAEQFSYDKKIFNLKEKSSLKYFAFKQSISLNRNQIAINLLDPGCEAQSFGLSLCESSQQIDHHTSINHIAEKTLSNQLYKSIAFDNATSIFNGRIFIAPKAQEVESSQLSQNLLLSKRAKILSKPELDVKADNVKANHGVSIGQLDRDQIFYLKSRGLNERQAYNLLLQGYILDLVSLFDDTFFKKFTVKLLYKQFEMLSKKLQVINDEF
jgi:Fe-S cluster assembly protein SufD